MFLSFLGMLIRSVSYGWCFSRVQIGISAKIIFDSTSGDNIFILSSSQNEEIQIIVPYHLPVWPQYQITDFECIPFISPSFYKEDNIFQVIVEKKHIGRIGWIFPIQSLLSDIHTHATNEHFLKYAFVSFYKLLRGEYFEEDMIIESSSLEAEMELSDIYNTSLLVLAISIQKTNTIPNFTINNYLHSLYGYKYFYCKSTNDLYSLKLGNVYTVAFSEIRIKEISPYLKDEIFIQSLYKDHLKESNHPLVQFHLLYQIIELLIEKIYDSEVNITLLSAKEKLKTPHEIRKEIEKISTEEYRIQRLCKVYLTKPLAATVDLVNTANLLLKEFNKEKQDFADAFYQVRNLLVHNFRGVTSIDPKFLQLKNIIYQFENLLENILTTYKNIDPLQESLNEGMPLQWLQYQLLLENKSPIPKQTSSNLNDWI